MIDKFWVKFDELDVECFCKDGNKKCPSEKNPLCEEYIIKLIKIERNKVNDDLDILNENVKKLIKIDDKFKSEISKVIKKIKI